MKLINKLKTWFKYDRDYYNNSENDIENIILELKKEVNSCFVNFKRVNFLLNEAFTVINLQKQKYEDFSLTEEEINNIIGKTLKRYFKK
jgi:hypothetical protein